MAQVNLAQIVNTSIHTLKLLNFKEVAYLVKQAGKPGYVKGKRTGWLILLYIYIQWLNIVEQFLKYIQKRKHTSKYFMPKPSLVLM